MFDDDKKHNTENTNNGKEGQQQQEESKLTLSDPDRTVKSIKNNGSESVAVSLTPPSQQQQEQQLHLPTVVFDVEQIVGYKPTSADEVETIREQMMTAMWQRYWEISDQSRPEEENKHRQEIPPPDFDDQIVDLLHAKMARFGNTETSRHHDDGGPLQQHQQHRQQQQKEEEEDNQSSTDDGKISIPTTIRLQYPPKIQRPSTSSFDEEVHDLLDTADLWNDIDRLARVIDIVPASSQQDEPENADGTFMVRLTKHLKATGQSLIWKHDMANELESMARSEQERISLDEWTTSTRQTKLEHLYSIRETLVHQEELAKLSYDALNDEREEMVKQKLLQHDAAEKARRRRHQLSGGGWLIDDDGNIKHDTTTTDGNDPDPFLSDNFGTSALDFPEDFKLLGMVGSNNPHELEDNDDQDEWSVDEDDDYDDYDDYDSNDDSYNDDESRNRHSQRVDEDGYENDDVASASTDDKPDNDKSDGNKNDDVKPSNPEKQKDIMPDLKTGDIVDVLPTDFDQIGDAANEPHVLSTPFQKRQERRRKAKLRKRQERKEAARRAQAEQRTAVETQIRAEHTSNDLILAETFLRAIESKVKSVDDLLESLQEEVWEAEDEDEEEEGRENIDDVTSNKRKPNSKSSNRTSDEPALSLLDQILAMILGGLPPEPGITEEEHYAFIKNEHAYIVKGWEKHFGRLPPPIGYNVTQDKGDGFSTSSDRMQETRKTATVSSVEQRLALGIVDNDDDEWDAFTDDDDRNGDGDVDGSKTQKSLNTVTSQNKTDQAKLQPIEPPKPKRTGLRPGGRAKP